MDSPFELIAGYFVWLEFGSHLLIFECSPGIVVACLFLGLFSEEGVVQLEAAEIYTFIFLLQS